MEFGTKIGTDTNKKVWPPLFYPNLLWKHEIILCNKTFLELQEQMWISTNWHTLQLSQIDYWLYFPNNLKQCFQTFNYLKVLFYVLMKNFFYQNQTKDYVQVFECLKTCLLLLCKSGITYTAESLHVQAVIDIQLGITLTR